MRSLGVLLVALAGLVVLPGLASAAAASCPAAPVTAPDWASQGDGSGIWQLVQDQDASCQALADRLEQVDGDVKGGSDQAHGDAGAVKSAVDAVTSQLSSWTSANPLQVALPAGGSGQAVAVTNWPGDQQVAFDSGAAGQLDGIGQSQHGDLWVLIGVVVAVFVFDVFLRKVWP